jgi:HAD superfamily hydrolase (TIGR01509 family)
MSTTTPVGRDISKPPAGVVFDCDGVLVDSEPLHARATTEWAASLGITLTPDFFHDLVGMTVPQQIDLIVNDTDHDPQASYQAREQHFWTIADEIAPMLGVAPLAQRLHAAGTRIAIASNGSSRYLRHVIELLGIEGLIAGYVSADDVIHPKPHPEPYTRAAALLELPTSSCVAVEDSATGAASAVAAGLKVIRVDPALTGVNYPGHMQAVADMAEATSLLFGAVQDRP